MSALRCVVVDDEPLARSRLTRMLSEITAAPCEVVAQASNAVEAMTALTRYAPDVVFLDIQMPGISGIELAQRLRADADLTAVVFVTAHPEHAVRAFELHAADYLTKPVNTQRLLDCVQRLVGARALAPAPPLVVEDADVIVVQGHQRVVRLALADVLVLRADLKYVSAVTLGAEHVLTQTLAELEEGWPQLFLRVHRSALVSRRALLCLRRATSIEPHGADAAERWEVQLNGVRDAIAVSRRQLPAVRDALHAVGR